jgi:hypothetical protein
MALYVRFEVLTAVTIKMWHREDLVWTNVSEGFVASIFRVEKSVSKEPV